MTGTRAQEIREQMSIVRQRLERDVDVMAEEAREFVDWRNVVRRHPVAVAAVSAAVGYLLVPRRRPERGIDVQQLQELVREATESKQSSQRSSGVLGSLIRTATGAAIRAGVGFAAAQIGAMLAPTDPGPTSHAMESETSFHVD